jgi:hypothetical protein
MMETCGTADSMDGEKASCNRRAVEWLATDLLTRRQAQPFRPKTNPPAGMDFLCRVVVVPAQMLLEVAFGVGEILLGDHGEHASVWGWISSHSCGESGGS